MARKKKRQLSPRRMRMTHQGRLSSAKATGWVNKYSGKNIIKSYSKWFAVDLLCALIDLRMLGVNITPGREAQILASFRVRAAEKQRRKKAAVEAELEDLYFDSDDTFAYIAGYTPGGAPYGVTWEELGEEPPWLGDENGNESIEPQNSG